MAQTYFIGDTATLTAVFTDTISGTVVDPAAVTLSVQAPNGAETDYPYDAGSGIITRESDGRYRAEYPIAQAGQYRYRWRSVGPDGVETGSFRSHRTPFDN